jgi:hypothetical protein
MYVYIKHIHLLVAINSKVFYYLSTIFYLSVLLCSLSLLILFSPGLLQLAALLACILMISTMADSCGHHLYRAGVFMLQVNLCLNYSSCHKYFCNDKGQFNIYGCFCQVTVVRLKKTITKFLVFLRMHRRMTSRRFFIL